MAKNILLVVIDQFRADCLAAVNSEATPKSLSHSVELPNLRALMQDGMTFNQHYTVTTPCGPSRASLLTGLYAMNHRSVRNGTPLGKHHKTLGNYMRTVGYEPMLFGYTDISADPDGRHPKDPDLKDYEGLSQGFVEAIRMRGDSGGGPWVGYLKRKGYPVPEKYGELYRPVLDANTASSQDPLGSPIRSPALYSAEDSDTAFLTDRTIEALWAKTNVPWFSMVTYIRPHPPLVAPSPFNTMVDPASIPKPAGSRSIDELKATHPFYEGFFSEPSNKGLYIGFDGDHESLSEQHSAELRAVYLGLAKEVDEHLGRLIDFLKESGQYEDTLVVVTADHGEMLGDHGLWGKNSPMDPALRLPLIIRDPSMPQSHGTSTDMLTESVDLVPTLLDWCDGEKAPALDGRSLMPFIKGSNPGAWRKHVFAEVELGEPDVPTRFERSLGLSTSNANYAVLRDHQFKYVHFNGGLPPMLFDMQNDPSEDYDLAQNTEYADVLRQFTARMLDHRMSHAERSLSNLKVTDDGLFVPPKNF
ncbi:alkaline phosphatase family protein [Granulosicoccus sp.]|nr:alkaline phosphatase family protein [Granulosicoccus sp.]MDB4223588.1 alkaline phosphatase family protein [Granulosicoccus sp.]